MLRFTLLALTLGLLKSEVNCGALGRISKSDESLLPRTEGELPSHWGRSNVEFPLGSKVLVNATRRIAKSGDSGSKRQAKFLPKFSILAGLDIGGGLAASQRAVVTNLTPIAKVSQSSSLPILNPYFAASYDPYPASSAVQQSLQALYQLVEGLRLQVDNFNKLSNNSPGEETDSLFTAENVNTEMIDDRKRRKDKLKAKKTTTKRKKQEKVSQEEEREEQHEEDDEVQVFEEKELEEILNKLRKVKSGSRNGAGKNPSAKQTQAANTTDTSMETGMEVNATNSNMTNENTTWQWPGYYYGGNPQNIGNVGLTYDSPQQSYGPPSTSYGAPSSSYGTPSYSYGAPSYTYGSPFYNYGPPSRGYGPPSQAYEAGHYSAFHDHESVVYDDPSENSFGFPPSERWQQRLPFARSQKLETSTRASRNGFVPI